MILEWFININEWGKSGVKRVQTSIIKEKEKTYG